MTPKNPTNTTVSGIVLDNANAPLVNVTASIEGTTLTALTDKDGRFTISNAPVGSINLFIDGSTSTEQEPYPFLEFPLVTVAGQDNHLPSPIFLPELDLDNSKVVGGDEDVTLTMKGVPGVVFTVFAHSATFPDGSHVGRLSVSQVHSDKVPMPPPNATAPQLFWTVQPPRVKFNPPMRIQIPNSDGLKAGTVTEIFCYNHDLEEFASGGTARVSEDGAYVVSDAGSGVIVSGWGSAPPPPPPPTCASNCPCGKCIKGVCVPLPLVSSGNACDDNNACTVNDKCNLLGQCKGEKIEIKKLTIKVDGKTDPFFGTLVRVINRAINFTVEVDSSHCDGITYDWDFGDGSHSSDQSPTHTYTVPGDYHPSVKAKCKTCADKQTSLRLFVVKVTIDKPTGDPATAGSDDNQFTYSGTLFGSTTVPVQAKVEPDTAESSVSNMIHWSLSAVPNGSSLSWFTPCPDDDQKGCGTFDIGSLTGYPNTNDQFGRKTITMNVIDDDGNTLITANTDIELFFDRDGKAISHSFVANWFYYWNPTAAGNPNATFASTSGAFGTTPAMLNWGSYSGPRSTVTIDSAVLGTDTRRDGSGQSVSGIDLFANTVRHEMRHVQQIMDSNATPGFFTGKTGVLRNAAASGWSFNTGCHAGLWNHFVDIDHSNSFTPGDTDLDTNCDDLPDTIEPTPADFASCTSAGQPIECQAERAETVPQDTFKAIDWSNPGKQHH